MIQAKQIVILTSLFPKLFYRVVSVPILLAPMQSHLHLIGERSRNLLVVPIWAFVGMWIPPPCKTLPWRLVPAHLEPMPKCKEVWVRSDVLCAIDCCFYNWGCKDLLEYLCAHAVFLHRILLSIWSHILCSDTGAKKATVSKIQISKSIDALGGTLKVNPSYNVPASSIGAKLGYSIDNTSVQVDSSAKKITLSHCFGKDTVSPSVTTSGDFSLSYSRTLPQGTLTTSWTPDDSIGVTWNDGEWTTTFKAPIDGFINANQGIKVNMRRTIDFN